jgi:hypothetical protein
MMLENRISISVILATIGRPTLANTLRSLSQLRKEEEVIILVDGWHEVSAIIDSVELQCKKSVIYCRDNIGFWGHPNRNRFSKVANGTHVMHFDDDDVYVPGAFNRVRREIANDPNSLLIFGYDCGWKKMPTFPKIEYHNVSTQCYVIPNKPQQFGHWGLFYGGDCEFAQTCQFGEPKFFYDVISVRRPHESTNGTPEYTEAIEQYVR